MKRKWLSKDRWCLSKEWCKWEWMKDVSVGWAANCLICCHISLKHSRSDSVTVVIWYVGYAQWFREYASVLRSQSDRVVVRVLGGSSMSAEAEYMRLNFLFHVLFCASLDWFEHYKRVCVCAVYNRCVFSVYSILWCIGYFTGFYNKYYYQSSIYKPPPEVLEPHILVIFSCI